MPQPLLRLDFPAADILLAWVTFGSAVIKAEWDVSILRHPRGVSPSDPAHTGESSRYFTPIDPILDVHHDPTLQCKATLRLMHTAEALAIGSAGITLVIDASKDVEDLGKTDAVGLRGLHGIPMRKLNDDDEAPDHLQGDIVWHMRAHGSLLADTESRELGEGLQAHVVKCDLEIQVTVTVNTATRKSSA